MFYIYHFDGTGTIVYDYFTQDIAEAFRMQRALVADSGFMADYFVANE